MKMRLIGIDAWRCDEGGWDWNSWYNIEEGIFMERPTTRIILRCLRKWGFLTEQSKGKLAVEDDQYNFVVVDKNTREPLLALCYGEYL